MSLKQQKCNSCKEMHEVIITSPQSKYVKICLDCYVKYDTVNRKDFGIPEVKRNTGTHDEE